MTDGNTTADPVSPGPANFTNLGPQMIPEPTSYNGRYHIALPVLTTDFLAHCGGTHRDPPAGVPRVPDALTDTCLQLNGGTKLQLPLPKDRYRLSLDAWVCLPGVDSKSFFEMSGGGISAELVRDDDGTLELIVRPGDDSAPERRIIANADMPEIAEGVWYRFVILLARRRSATKQEMSRPNNAGVDVETTMRIFLLGAGSASLHADAPVFTHIWTTRETPGKGGRLPGLSFDYAVLKGAGVKLADIHLCAPAPGGELLAHWPLLHAPTPSPPTRDPHWDAGANGVEDVALNDKNWPYAGGRNWPPGHHGLLIGGNAPEGWAYVDAKGRVDTGARSGQPAVMPRAASAAMGSRSDVRAAVTAAQSSGQLDPALFPYVTVPANPQETAELKGVLAGLDPIEVQRRYEGGEALCICARGISRTLQVSFIPAAGRGNREPRLFLILNASLTSYPTRLGPGRVAHTMSLFPGETTTVSVRTFRKSTKEAQQSSSILDSYTTTAADDFEKKLQDEQTLNHDEDFTQSYYAKLEAEASWGWGNASAEVSGKWDINDSKKTFSRQVSDATTKHAASASTGRNVQVNSSFREVTETEETESIERVVKNLNVGRTLNFVFYQLNQEIVTFLHLTDVKLGFFNGDPESVDEVPLRDARGLLARVLDPAKVDAAYASLKAALGNLRDCNDKPLKIDKADPPSLDAFFIESGDTLDINRACVSNYEGITLDGAILSRDTTVMRTDNMYVDSFLGATVALDDYAHAVQIQEARSRELENEMAALRLEAIKLGMDLVKSDKAEAAKALQALLWPPEPVGAGKAA